MSSSGKGQSIAKSADEVAPAWDYAVANMRGDRPRVIVEEFIEFDSEITLLTIATEAGVLFCAPIGHRQEAGDYRESWQPAGIADGALLSARRQARKVVEALGGYGIFGVEFFVKGDQAIFSELSPRPHDTGMVTMITQFPNQFELHLRAVLELPIPAIELAASRSVGGDPAGARKRGLRLRGRGRRSCSRAARRAGRPAHLWQAQDFEEPADGGCACGREGCRGRG